MCFLLFLRDVSQQDQCVNKFAFFVFKLIGFEYSMFEIKIIIDRS